MSVERAGQLLSQLGDHYYYGSEGYRGPKPSYRAASQRIVKELRRELGADAVPVLIELLQGGPSSVAVEAARALGKMGDWQAVEPLVYAFVVGETEVERFRKDPWSSLYRGACEFTSACREALEGIGGVRLKDTVIQLVRLESEAAKLATKLGSRQFRENAPLDLTSREEDRLQASRREIETLRSKFGKWLESHT